MDPEVEIKKFTFFSEVRGIIYIRNSYIADLQAFQEGMQERYSVIGIEGANFKKPRDPQTRAFVVKFRGDACPQYGKISGEHVATKVCQCKEMLPMSKLRTLPKEMYYNVHMWQMLAGGTWFNN